MITAIIKLTALLGSGFLLATELPPILASLNEAGQVLTTANDMDMVKTLVFQYHEDKGHYPDEAALSELLTNSIGGRHAPDQDRWGEPFQIAGLPAFPYVLSCGPDTDCGNKDDLKLYIEKIPEGEKQLDFSDLVQTNLLAKLKFLQRESDAAATTTAAAVPADANANAPSDFEKALNEVRQKAAAEDEEDEEDKPPPPKMKKKTRHKSRHSQKSPEEE